MSDSDAFAAFADAVEYFHSCLDEEIADHAGQCTHDGCAHAPTPCERPTTAREYFTEHRGWTDETLDEWKLGYAPAEGGLADHLRGLGYDEETMRATGLFTKHLTALWRGRYILPYLNEDSVPVYAIARTTGSLGGGKAGYDGHPKDFISGKYGKVAHTKDYVPVEEPIFGPSTLEEGQDVVVAEGIADAITAAEAGYSVLSPVTTQFKQQHYDELLDLLSSPDNNENTLRSELESLAEESEDGVYSELLGYLRDDTGRTVYVVPDSERASFSRIDSDDVPEESDNIFQAVNLPKVSPGMGGALRTANYLCENGLDARVVELPRPGLRKVDLDDYLRQWPSDLKSSLSAAKPPHQHPDFAKATEGQVTDASADTRTNGEVPEGRPASDSDFGDYRTDGMSALWDLPIEEVNPSLQEGYRGRNPLGHTGDSEEYFHLFRPSEDSDLLAMDYKRKVKYNGLTYLLCEEEERDVSAPQGPLTPKETWVAWSAARERGLIGADDTIPAAALRHIAEERGLYNFEALPDDVEALPAKAHNKALWWVKNDWWDEEEEEEEATARNYKAKDPEEVLTWEDVRYIYDGEDGSKRGRHAAEILLRSRHSFMTVQGTDQLHVYDEETGVYTPHTAEVRGEIRDGLGVEWSTHELNEITARLKQKPIVEPRHLNGRAHFDDPHLCVGNGVLNLFTRELKEFSPDYHFVDRIPTKYDEDADTTPYEEVLDDWTGREEDALAMMEMVGHALVPDAHERGFKKFLILHGDANNGKSVFYDRVGDLLNGPDGEESNTANVKLEKLASNRFSKNSIYGSMANIAGEIDGKWIHNTADLKDITGGDAQEIEPKGGDSFFDAINSTLMFAANDPPKLGVRDAAAIATRIVPVELPYTFTSNPEGPMEKKAVPEQKLTEKLTTEEAMSGFLNLALDGIERLEENWGDVSLPESEMERYKLYNQSADPMTEFGSVCIENSADDYIVKADVTAIYKRYAADNGYDLGTNPHDTLHKVLKSLPDLNYADSRPRAPDYSDTSLPLRSWDERKNVVKRVTLTEEGLHYAEEAGLVVEQEDEQEEEHGATLADIEQGEHASITATVGGFLNPKDWLAAEGWLTQDGVFNLDFEVREALDGSHPFSDVNKGDKVCIKGAEVKPKENGVRYVEVTPKCTVEVVEDATQTGDSQTAQAATDGGEEDAEEEDDEQPAEEEEAEESGETETKQLRALSLDLAEFIGEREVKDHELWTAWAPKHDLDDPKGTIEQIVTKHDHVGELKDGVYRSLL